MDWAQLAVDYLNDQLGITVYHTAPQTKPNEFAVLRLSTTLQYDKVQVTPQFIVTVYAKSRARAAELAEAVRMAMFFADESIDDVFGVSMVGDYRELNPPMGYEQRILTFQWKTNV